MKFLWHARYSERFWQAPKWDFIGTVKKNSIFAVRMKQPQWQWQQQGQLKKKKIKIRNEKLQKMWMSIIELLQKMPWLFLVFAHSLVISPSPSLSIICLPPSGRFYIMTHGLLKVCRYTFNSFPHAVHTYFIHGNFLCLLFNYTTTILHQSFQNDKVYSHIISVFCVFVI